MRPLLLPAAQALAINPGAALAPSSLLHAGYLLRDLHAKAAHLLAKARPTFLAASQQVRPPGAAPCAAVLLGAAPRGPHCSACSALPLGRRPAPAAAPPSPAAPPRCRCRPGWRACRRRSCWPRCSR